MLADTMYLAEHELVGDDSECEVVRNEAVVLSADDLRGCIAYSGTHIAGRSASIAGILLPVQSSDSQVRNADVPFVIEHKIFRLNVPMDDVLLMEVLQPENDTRYEEF